MAKEDDARCCLHSLWLRPELCVSWLSSPSMGVLGTGCAGWSTVALGLQGQRAPLRPARLVSKSGSQGKKRSWDFGDGEDLRAPGAICSRFRWGAGGAECRSAASQGSRENQPSGRRFQGSLSAPRVRRERCPRLPSSGKSPLLPCGEAVSDRSEAGPSRGKVIQSERSRCQV